MTTIRGMFRYRRRWLPGMVLMLLCALPHGAAAATLAVVYPELSSAYARVFDTIISGVGQVEGVSVLEKRLAATDDATTVQAWLRDNEVSGVICLGQRGHELAERMDIAIPVVVGAALLSPNGVTGISLAAEPEQFFERLGSLTPPVTRVFTVYSESNTGWLMERARTAARRHGIELDARVAGDVREAAQEYRAILELARDSQDAIWIPLDTVAPDRAVLPKILEAAWRHRLVVFSNNPAHVQRGVLFSLFPDHEGLGRQLAEMAIDLNRQPDAPPRVVPLSELKVAVNVRTASHLGMLYTPSQRERFALVFPSR